MESHLYREPGPFLEVASSYLASEPLTTNVLGTHTEAAARGERDVGEEDVWLTLLEGGSVVGVAMRTRPHNLFVSRLAGAAAPELVRRLVEEGVSLPGVNGERDAVEAVAAAWCERTGGRSTTVTSMRMYRLGELRPPGGVAGEARSMQEGDIGLVAGWLGDFHAEAMEHAPVPDARGDAERHELAGDLVLWCAEGRPVSLAAFHAPAAGVARIGPVFTPVGERRRGYGGAVSASATARALELGATHVVLYADLANVTANRIYQAIGYLADHEAEERRLDLPSE
jgi:FR47-like protein